MKIGFHLPIARGFAFTLREAQRLGCAVVQIFVKNPRSWSEKRWRDADIAEFTKLSAVLPVRAHLSYLPNLARSREERRHCRAFLHEVALAAQLGIGEMVIHCGSHEDRERGIEAVAQSIDEALAAHPLMILLENAAGQGRAIGTSLSELAEIHNRITANDRVGLCLDTAHLFEAGYDVRKRVTWKAIAKEVADRFGPGKIRFFHLNDSKTALGSRVDRHWHIGKGEIGLDCFRVLLREKQFAHLSGVMETPKVGGMDEVNMKVIRSLPSPLVPGPSS